MRTLVSCLICVAVLAPAPAARAEVSLREAIKCSDFKRNPDGSWYAESVSLNYGPNNSRQMNLFDATIRQKKEGDRPDLWAILNEKCAAGK